MPETREITVFKYEELEGRAKDKARDWYMSTLDYEWWDGDDANAKEEGKNRGFDIDDIRFRGFASQGDGASWTGHIIVRDFVKWMMEQPEDSPQYRRIGGDRHRYTVLQEIIEADYGSDMPNLIERCISVDQRSFHYSHSGTMQVDEIDYSYLYDIMDSDDPDNDETIPAGVLKGASIKELAKGIDADGLFYDLRELMETEAKEYADSIYKQLESTWNSMCEDEYIADAADANDWRFDENGKIVF